MMTYSAEQQSKLRTVSTFEHPVLLFSNGYGDTLLALPALRALTEILPTPPILICNETAYHLCLEELRIARPVFLTCQHGSWPDRIRFDSEAIAAASKTCDLFLSVVPWASHSLDDLCARLAPELSIGLGHGFDINCPRDYDKHTADLTFDIVQALNPWIRIEDYAQPPRYSSRAQKQAHDILSLIPKSFRILTVHMDTLPEKMWSRERFKAVLDTFLAVHPDYLVLVVGMSDWSFQDAEYSAQILPCNGLPLDETMCLVSLSDLFLGIDSCMLHAADMARVPGVGLFGPTQAHEFGFRFGPHRHVESLGTMDQIDVDWVVCALEDLLAEVGNQAPRRATPEGS
jgi:hypothetical protein